MLIESSLETVGVAKSDIFAAVDEAGELLTDLSECLPVCTDGTKRSVLSGFIGSARNGDALGIPVVFLGTHLSLQVAFTFLLSNLFMSSSLSSVF
jgi:hypothetical protein